MYEITCATPSVTPFHNVFVKLYGRLCEWLCECHVNIPHSIIACMAVAKPFARFSVKRPKDIPLGMVLRKALRMVLRKPLRMVSQKVYALTGPYYGKTVMEWRTRWARAPLLPRLCYFFMVYI